MIVHGGGGVCEVQVVTAVVFDVHRQSGVVRMGGGLHCLGVDGCEV